MVLIPVCCMAAGPIDVRVIESFERPDALEAWTLRGSVSAQLVSRHATHGLSAVRLQFPAWREGAEQWPAALLSVEAGRFPADWSSYDQLLLDVVADGEAEVELKLRLDSTTAYHQVSRMLPPGVPTTFEVDLTAIGPLLDLTKMESARVFMSRPRRDTTVCIDHLRLAARRLDAQHLMWVPDPFGSGHAGVVGRVTRPARVTFGVLDAGGRTVSIAERSGRRIEWRWDGRTRAGAPVEPGEYRIVARIYDPRRRETPPTIAELGVTEVLPPAQRPEMLIWPEPTTRKVMLHSRPPEHARALSASVPDQPSDLAPPGLTVQMARNEVEGAQLVVLTREEMRLSFEVEHLRHDETGEAFPAGGVEVLQVGYVETEAPGLYQVDHVGWWPDPLVPQQQLPEGQMTAEPHECMPVWINFDCDGDTAPGVYSGWLSIRRKGRPLGRVPLQLRVYDVELPESTTVRTAFTLGSQYISGVYGERFDDDLMMAYCGFVADHRINPDDLYRGVPPDIELLRRFARQGRLNAFNIRFLHSRDGWNDRDLRELAGVLDPYIQRLREEGLAEHAYFYGWDEQGAESYAEIARVARFLHDRYPEIALMTTAKDPTFGLDSGLDGLVDVWVPLTQEYNRERAQAARERGTQVWWYVSIATVHPYANWFVEYPAIEARLLWWMTWQQDVDGFLYYRMARWPNAQGPMILDGRNRTGWDPQSFRTANGDGSLICPGPDGPITTIRLENIRDGIEDHELLTMLAQKRGDEGARSRELCDELIASATEFTRDTRQFAHVRQRLLEECAAP